MHRWFHEVPMFLEMGTQSLGPKNLFYYKTIASLMIQLLVFNFCLYFYNDCL